MDHDDTVRRTPAEDEGAPAAGRAPETAAPGAGAAPASPSRAWYESDEQLQAVLDHLPVGIWFTDASGSIVYGNPAGQRIWAGARYVGPDEFQEYRGWWDDTGEPIGPDDWAGVRAIRHGETSLGEVVRIQCFDGSQKIILNSAVPMRGPDGEVVGAAILNEDITERRRTETALRNARDHLERTVDERTRELLQTNAELARRRNQMARLTSELTLAEQNERRRLAHILHDHLQQLLVGAKLGLERLRQHVAPDQQPAFERVVGLIAEGIAESRQLTVELSPPILHEVGLVAGLEWLVRSKFRKYGLVVEFSSDDDAETASESAKVFLFEAARELLLNVAKHAGTLAARLELRRPDADQLVLVVRDEGDGCDLQAIFASDEDDGSSHFGLFSIRERARLLGGDVAIESVPGQGTRVQLSVPAPAPAAAPDRGAAVAGRGPAVTGIEATTAGRPEDDAHIRTLLVDDHAVMREGLVALLEDEDDILVVGEAADGEQALALARRLRPDVVLMDFSMPGMDGVAATRAIRNELPSVRVIGLSMYPESDRGAAMLAAGATVYVSKSDSAASLLAAIRATARAR